MKQEYSCSGLLSRDELIYFRLRTFPGMVRAARHKPATSLRRKPRSAAVLIPLISSGIQTLEFRYSQNLPETLLCIPCDQRAVFILRSVLGMSDLSVAAATGFPVEAAQPVQPPCNVAGEIL